MNFNISLSVCATLNCTTERQAASQIGSLNSANTAGSRNNNDNISIYIPIGAALAALAAVTALIIYGSNKCCEPLKEVTELLNPQTNEELGAENPSPAN